MNDQENISRGPGYLFLNLEELLGPDDPYVVQTKNELDAIRQFKERYGTEEGVRQLTEELSVASAGYEEWAAGNPLEAEWVILHEATASRTKQREWGMTGVEIKQRADQVLDELGIDKEFSDLINYLDVGDEANKEHLRLWQVNNSRLTDETIGKISKLRKGYTLRIMQNGARTKLQQAINYLDKYEESD